MNTVQNKALHALLNELGIMEQKASIVFGASRGRTEQSRELTIEEAQALITSLKEQKNTKGLDLRRRIIHRMCLLGYIKEDTTPDYQRINGFIQNRTGQRNPGKKNLNYLNLKELHAVLQQVEAIYKATIKSISNGTGANNRLPENNGPDNAGAGAGSAEGSIETPE